MVRWPRAGGGLSMDKAKFRFALGVLDEGECERCSPSNHQLVVVQGSEQEGSRLPVLQFTEHRARDIPDPSGGGPHPRHHLGKQLGVSAHPKDLQDGSGKAVVAHVVENLKQDRQWGHPLVNQMQGRPFPNGRVLAPEEPKPPLRDWSPPALAARLPRSERPERGVPKRVAFGPHSQPHV